MELPREFAFLVACCRWPRSPAGDEEVRALAAGADWDAVLAAAGRHRVEGFVHDAVTRSAVAPPPTVAGRLAAQASGIARENLFYAAEALRLSLRFAGAGIAHLFVKGVTLNVLAFGTLALKRSCDIDLLVEPEDYAAACATLGEADYSCFHPPGADLGAILRYAAAEKDSAWRHEPTGIKLELHQRLTVNPMLLPDVGARSPSLDVAIAPGVTLPTLARNELFAYLCVHGALTAWSRLKWLVDLAALVSGADEDGLERLCRRAAALAPGRATAQALLLAERLFGIRLPASLSEELRADRANRYLERAAIHAMTAGGAREIDEQPLASARLNLSVLMLQPGWRYKAAEIGRKLPRVPAALRSALGAARAG
jgi:hypothetical protein